MIYFRAYLKAVAESSRVRTEEEREEEEETEEEEREEEEEEEEEREEEGEECLPSVDLSPGQLFWVGHAQNWCDWDWKKYEQYKVYKGVGPQREDIQSHIVTISRTKC